MRGHETINLLDEVINGRVGCDIRLRVDL